MSPLSGPLKGSRMKIGDLVKMKRQPTTGGLPVGLVVDTEHTVSGEHCFCVILWDDGTMIGAWKDELRDAS